jgi:hypothetical protein
VCALLVAFCIFNASEDKIDKIGAAAASKPEAKAGD